MQKNVASQKVQLFAFDVTTGAAKTGDAANLTAYVSKDYGAVTVLTDTSASEMDATNAPGWYMFDLAQAETNADELLFTAKSSTGNISVVGRPIATTPAAFTSGVAQTGDNFARLGAPAGASVSADIAAVKAETALIVADTNELQTDWVNGGRLDLILDARASQTSVDTIDTNVDAILVDTAEIGAAGAGLTALATAANLATVAGYLDTEIALILADTNELQTDWANGGRLDLILDARASQTSVDTIDAIVDDILLDTGTDGVVVATASKTGYRLSSTGVDDVLDEVVEGSTTLRHSVRLANAALGSKASGLAGVTAVYRDIGDTKDRITATVDADGNRTAVTTDLT